MALKPIFLMAMLLGLFLLVSSEKNNISTSEEESNAEEFEISNLETSEETNAEELENTKLGDDKGSGATEGPAIGNTPLRWPTRSCRFCCGGYFCMRWSFRYRRCRCIGGYRCKAWCIAYV